MANTTKEFASPQETQRALALLLDLQEGPGLLEGFFNKYPDSNPFTSWPLLAEPTEAFLRFFEKTTPVPEQGAETITPTIGPYTETVSPLGPQSSVDAKQLQALIDVFNEEIETAKQGKLRASNAAQKFVAALKENATRSKAAILEEEKAPAPQEHVREIADIAGARPIPPPPEAQKPAPQEAEGVPISPERVQAIISATIQQPLPAEEQKLFFHALTSVVSKQPDKDFDELVPRASAVVGAARVLAVPGEALAKEKSFSALATNGFQENIAKIFDVVVRDPAAKEAIINRVLLGRLDAVVNHTQSLPKEFLGEMVNRWGEGFVNSAWFNQLRADTNRMMGDQTGAVKIKSGLVNFVSDVATTVFLGPLETRVAGLGHNIITYIETYRLVATQGIPMDNVSHYGSIALGYGGQLVRMGAKYAIKAGIKAGVKKAAVSTAVKVGAEAVLGAGTGGLSFLVTLGLDLVRGLFNKGVSFFKSLVGMGVSKNPEDSLLIVGAVGVALVFFLPLFPLFNLPAFNQSMIDTSLATNMGGGMEFGPIINCQLTPDDPQCTFTACVGDCRWPASGYISQGPRTGSYCSVRTSHASGSAANGIDIAAFGGPVYTPRAGIVVEVYTGCANNSGYVKDRCGGTPQRPEYAGYGNHVILTTDDGYTLIFGHLESAVGVQVGQHVAAGAQLGWMDQTGSSSGTHLHFGVLAGGNVLDFVPPGDPALSPDAINGCVTNTPGCTKSCPTVTVTAGQ